VVLGPASKQNKNAERLMGPYHNNSGAGIKLLTDQIWVYFCIKKKMIATDYNTEFKKWIMNYGNSIVQ
jgi:hypothetical protein